MLKLVQSLQIGLITWLGLVGVNAAANAPVTALATQQLDPQQQLRERFIATEQLLQRRELKEYKLMRPTVDGYILAAYLDAQYWQRYAKLSDAPQVRAFIREHQQSPLGWQTRQAWLDKLMEEHHYEAFMHDYQLPATTAHQCFYLYSQLATGTGDTTPVLQQVDAIWLTGESLPDACDAVLEAWTNAGRRTDAMVWQRIALAADGGKHTLIPYLQKMLPQDMQPLAEHFRAVRRNPKAVTNKSKLSGQYPQQETEIVAYGLRRLIWQEPDMALAFIESLPTHITFTADQYREIRQTFATALSLKGHDHASRWLARIEPTEHTDSTLHWQLAEWLRRGAWSQIVGLVPRLPDSQRETDQWQYWFARALNELGHTHVAQQVWARVAQQRSYYGFLAAAKLNQPLSLAREALEMMPEDISAVRQLPGVQRAKELRQLDRQLEARREWNALLDHTTEHQQRALAIIASEWEWHDQAIYTLGRIGAFDAISQRFPAAFLDEHLRFANAANIDVNWALAVSRRESAFRNDARSHAGAYGLMQLLPSTAKLIARKDVTRLELFNPSYNISLGTRYLSDLQRRLGNNWLLATAAYNAGIYRVYDWLPAQPVEADRWIEMIPYHETRNYVKNVLAYQQIYRTLRDNDSSPDVFKQLEPMTIGVISSPP
ncbi:transglycosylase SLT domain-containing protein [Pseudidiomarina donghaiensis]|uniref:Murein transglycosylase n=1 Tax=Pseudidiomarina donghaiensis TaxID=519452 RepID=A0A432XH73_9GAMM|nr:transglycosylase SLT domain-containing protein [Pseudidiomarina donghaiensis]RUO47966.1 murein transglycosylase [Pseudidiomarina donghaiensis]SFV22712.1 soluble lytic murein transglycosylase [Pseudidiomarina donghaiensis]